MRAIFGVTISLLLLVNASQAGLVHRRFRELQETPAVDVLLNAPTTSDLRTDQIPVTVIEIQAPLATALKPATEKQEQPLIDVAPVVPETAAPVSADIIAPQTEILKAALETAEIAEDIAKKVEKDQKLRAVGALIEAERRKDELVLEDEVKQVILEENKELLQAELKKVEGGQNNKLQPEASTSVKKDIQQELKKQPVETEQPLASPVAAPAVVAEAAAQEPETLAIVDGSNFNELKAIPVVDEAVVVIAEEPQQTVLIDEKETLLVPSGEELNLRQATQATPTATTQQNFVQQLIQNSPLGQFISQITGTQNQQQQPSQPPAGAASDEPVAPAAPPAPPAPLPTLPGFLNPANAITSAQQAVQNVVNSTTQAFQGFQQFASSLGNQFQNTLSSLSGQNQNQLSTADSTTPRPPGPIQAIISNFVGGNQQPAEAATAAPAAQGPFQGIISFFQGGNRPQGSGTPAVVAAAAAAPPPAEPAKQQVATSIDDKIDQNPKKDELPDEEVDQALDQEQAAAIEIEADDATNEVRNSEEVGVDSFEDAHADDLIVVNDDASGRNQQEVVVA